MAARRASLTVSVAGLPALKKQFSRLADKLQRQVLGNALAAGGRILAAETRRRVPVREGNLKKAVGIRRRVSRTSATVTIGFKTTIARHAHLIEFGTAERFARSGPVGKGANRRVVRFTKPASRGSGQPQPFMRPAFAAKRREMIQKFNDEIGRQILRIARRAGISG